MSEQYWEECISEALCEARLDATQEQIDTIAEIVEGAHSVYGEATGRDVLDRNFHCSQESELQEAKRELAEEREKERCSDCEGFGRIQVAVGTSHYSTNECHKCNGRGRV